MTTALITVDDVKGQLPIRDGNDDFDVKLSLIVAATSLAIEGFCRRKFTLQTFTEFKSLAAGASRELDLYGDGWRTDIVRPPETPLRFREDPVVTDDPDNPIQLFYDRTRAFTPDTLLVLGTDYQIVGEVIYLLRPVPAGRDVLKLVYQAGYADDGGDPPTLSDSIPEDLKLAAITQCIYVFQRSDVQNVGANIDSGGTRGAASKAIVYQTPSGLIPDVQALLAPYRRQLVGRR